MVLEEREEREEKRINGRMGAWGMEEDARKIFELENLRIIFNKVITSLNSYLIVRIKMTRQLNDKSKTSAWFMEEFIKQISFDRSMMENCFEFENSTSKHSRSKSLSARIELENISGEFNVASTNQTSVEISIDEISISTVEGKTPEPLSLPNETEEPTKKSHETKTQSKQVPTKITRRRSCKGSGEVKSLSKATKTAANAKNKAKLENYKQSQAKKIIPGQFLNKDCKGSKKIPSDTLKISINTKPDYSIDRNRMLTPILSSKSTKYGTEKVKYQKLKENKVAVDKAGFNYADLMVDSMSSSKEFIDDNFLSERADEKGILDVKPKVEEDLADNTAEQIKVPLDPIQSESISKPQTFFTYKRPAETYTSPLRNVRKYTPAIKTAESPYQNLELAPEIAKVIEEIQRKLIFTDSSSQDSSPLNSERYIEYTHAENIKVNQDREPSFGFGGGHFSYIDDQIEEKNSELIYYEPSIKELAAEKQTQTDFEANKKDELYRLVTDGDFIRSLKIIGKFANFLERNM